MDDANRKLRDEALRRNRVLMEQTVRVQQSGDKESYAKLIEDATEFHVWITENAEALGITAARIVQGLRILDSMRAEMGLKTRLN